MWVSLELIQYFLLPILGEFSVNLVLLSLNSGEFSAKLLLLMPNLGEYKVPNCVHSTME